ncbi:MAG: hypothetical protein AAB443_04585 [Patescibacteria group bacterium]
MFLNQRGQTLIVMLLIMLAALAIGLAVSQRLVGSLWRSANLDNASRSDTVAHALVERVLTIPSATLDSYITNSNCTTDCGLTITGNDGVTSIATATLSYAGNSTQTFDVSIDKNSVYEISMTSYSGSASVELCWDNAISGSNPSVYVTYIYGSSAPYSISYYAYNSAATLFTANGFMAATPDLSYPNCFTISPKTSPQFMRLKALYNNVFLHVVPKNGASIPVQGYLISVTGQTGQVRRTLKLIKSKPFLSPIFDFTLFSTSGDTSLQN